jgi:caffeoyl-CoA O-methyltransferase
MNMPQPIQSTWDAVDRALEQWLAPQDEALQAATASADHEGLPRIAVSPTQGRLLEVLALAIGARRILEIGTLAGFSTIWLALGSPGPTSTVPAAEQPWRSWWVQRPSRSTH